MDSGLIYDIGAFNGDDSAYYLSRGYRVVGVEADPTLVTALRKRFAAEIADGRYTLLDIGIADQNGTATFYLVPERPIWNSFDPEMASRDGMTVEPITVQCRTPESILAEYGVPHFLKIDIEGMDPLCVRAVSADDPPAFVSFEAEEEVVDLVLELHQRGYRRFRLVNQQAWTPVTIPAAGSLGHIKWSVRQWLRLALRKLGPLHRLLATVRTRVFLALPSRQREPAATSSSSSSAWRFNKGSSGPMPTNSSDGWMDLAAFMATWVLARQSGILESAWFDVHAGHAKAARSEAHASKGALHSSR